MAQVKELCHRILGTIWRHSPVSASFWGIHDYDRLLPSYESEAIRGRTQELRDHLREVESLGAAGLPMGPEERLDMELVERELRTQIRSDEEIRSPFRNPGSYLEEASFGVYILLLREFAPFEERARRAASRLEAVPRMLEEARRNLANPSEVPALWAAVALDLVDSTLDFLEEAIARVREEAPAVLPEFDRAATRARAAVREYGRFLAERVRPAARGRYAVGREMFEFLLRVPHGLEDTVEELEAFGRSEVQETLRRLDEGAAALGTDQRWKDLVDSFRRDVPPAGRLVSSYQEEIGRAREFVHARGLVTSPPGESLKVVETPVFERKTTPFAAYIQPGPFEDRQEGYFWVTPPDPSLTEEERARRMEGHLLPGIPITSVHEGYPGHHLQISLANRVGSLPRRQIWTSVMVEGWALYCEEMMGEQGFYTDPRTRLLQLKDHLWRSCRVLIDVGLHTGSMTFEEAVKMLVEVPKLDPAGAEGEVKRYTRTPTQPLSYAVGKREILALREALAAAEGPAFTLRRFHDRLLQYGSIPVSLIRRQLCPARQA